MSNDIADLPEPVQRVLAAFLESARAALGPSLRAIVLYGSAAEGRLRATSDVNLLVVLSAFDSEKIDPLRETARAAHASIRLETMFLLESEIGDAVEAFAVKFADILRRRRVLIGDDPFANVRPSRRAEILRLRQVLLNMSLRLRQRYVLSSLREEQAALAIAEAAGPLRAAAAVLLELSGETADSPRAALNRFSETHARGNFSRLLEQLSEARELRTLPPGTAAPALLELLRLVDEVRKAAKALDDGAS